MEHARTEGRAGGVARELAIAVGALVVVLIALATWFARESREDALAPGAPIEDRERVAVSDADEVEPLAPAPASTRAPARRAVDEVVRLVLSGRVLDGAGAPVAGAALEAAPERFAATERMTSATRADGGFELDVLDAQSTYRLRVRADGFFPDVLEALVPGGAPTTVHLRVAPSLIGRVRSTAGQPIPGARVRLVAETELGDVLEVETVSDEAGTYRLAGGLLDSEHLNQSALEASAAGFAPNRVKLHFAGVLTSAPALTELERNLVLSPGNAWRGRVVDVAGAPVEDAEVVVFRHAGRGLFEDPYGTRKPSRLGPTAIATTKSAADGSFAFAGLPVRTGDEAKSEFAHDDEEMGSVRAHKPGFALGGARLPWTKEGEPTDPLEVVLARGASFRGRVVDEHGEPLDEAKVSIAVTGAPLATIVLKGMQPEGYGERIFWEPPRKGAKGYLWVQTDIGGRFCSPVLPCWSEGGVQGRFRPSWRDDDGAWRAFELSAGEERDFGDLVLALRCVDSPIEGIVHDPAGAPVAGAEVELQNAGTRRTDRDGNFRFELGIEPDEAFRALDLSVKARGFVTHREVLREAPEEPLAIGLARGLALRGTLRFQDGAPAAFGTVSFDRQPEPGRGWVFSDSITWTTCDALGRFAVDELPAPPWVITFNVYRPGFKLEEKLTLLEPRDELALVLPGVPPEFASLELDVTDANARDIADLRLPTLTGRDTGRIQGRQRDTRTFVFPVVAPGRYELHLKALGFAPYMRALELAPAEHARVQVTLEGGAHVTVRIEPTPARGAGLYVVAESAQHPRRSAQVRSDGLADIGVLAPSDWTVGLVAGGPTYDALARLGATRTFEVLAGDERLTWSLARPELGQVSLVLPVREPGDPSLPLARFSDEQSNLAEGDQHQAWWNAYSRELKRAQQLTIDFEDTDGQVVLSTAPEDIELDGERNRVLGFVTAPIGSYTLALRRGSETLRRAPVQVLADATVELDR
ncbi:MAG: carboxypeptidase-like regulatory domain-containing protein [Planctomycetota bacterium]